MSDRIENSRCWLDLTPRLGSIGFSVGQTGICRMAGWAPRGAPARPLVGSPGDKGIISYDRTGGGNALPSMQGAACNERPAGRGDRLLSAMPRRLAGSWRTRQDHRTKRRGISTPNRASPSATFSRFRLDRTPRLTLRPWLALQGLSEKTAEILPGGTFRLVSMACSAVLLSVGANLWAVADRPPGRKIRYDDDTQRWRMRL